MSASHLGTPRDVVVPSEDSPTYQQSMTAFKAWSTASHASSSTSSSPFVVVQLCHTGRQSTRGSGRSVFQPSKSASAVPVTAGKGVIATVMSRIMFGTPKEMSLRDIDIVVENFVQGARVVHEAGFGGLEIHCSHGYLLAQFLSPNVGSSLDLTGILR